MEPSVLESAQPPRRDPQWESLPTGEPSLPRIAFSAAATVWASLALLIGLLLLLLGLGCQGEEQAVTLDTHRQRKLLSAAEPLIRESGSLTDDANVGPYYRERGSLADTAEDWARRHFKREGSRHASAHLFYHEPEPEPGAKIKTWYHELKPRRSADDTYFAVQGNLYGYFGLQQVRGFPWFQGKVVFSMWDQGENKAQVVECGQDVFCTTFGGEGTGAKTYMNFNKWKLGNEYGFLIRSYDVGGGTSVRQEGYLFATELGGWRLMSVLEVVKETPRLPWDIAGMYSFVEQWSPRDFGDARWARFGPSFVEYAASNSSGGGGSGGGWRQVRTALFRQGAQPGEDTANCNANVTEEGHKWGLGIGGDVGLRPEGTEVTVMSFPDLPVPLRVFSDLDAQGTIPRGCQGGTCQDLYSREWYNWFFLPVNLPRTIVLALMACSLSTSVIGLVSCCTHSGRTGHGDRFEEVTCPDSHSLVAFVTPNKSFSCDGCEKKVKTGTILHGCRRCRYDLCVSCMSSALHARARTKTESSDEEVSERLAKR